MTDFGISRKQHQQLCQWFRQYVQQYASSHARSQAAFDMKRNHSWRVAGESKQIARKLGLSRQQQRLATVIGLLHDVGRFEQFMQYGTFVDHKSVNHAAFSVHELQVADILSCVPKHTQTIIEESVRLHNLPVLPTDANERVLFFARLLRDADKLDIWRVVLHHYQNRNGTSNPQIENEMPDTPGYSRKVIDALMRRDMLNFQYCNNLNDFKLKQMCWVFDLNYQPSFKQVAQRRIIERFLEVLPNDASITTLATDIHKFLAQSVRNSSNLSDVVISD